MLTINNSQNNVHLLAIMVDALRHDLITEKEMPYCYSLKSKGFSAQLEEPFGFLPRAAIFSGKQPDESNYMAVYIKAQGKSPFSFLRYFPKLTYSNPYIERFLRWFLSRIMSLFSRIAGKSTFYSFGNIPFKTLTKLDIGEKYFPWQKEFVQGRTFFDFLKENALQWLYLGYPKDNQRTSALSKTFQSRFSASHAFAWLHFAEFDWQQHKYGPDAEISRKALSKIDEAIRQIAETCEKHWERFHIIIFGDHGAVQVQKCINPIHELQQLNAVMHLDIEYVIDSTMIRFWVLHERVRTQLYALLSSWEEKNWGVIINQSHRNLYHLNFTDNRFGDIIFVANAGNLFLPNHFQGNNPLRGMHGYLPNVPDNRSALLCSAYKVKPLELSQQIYPMTILYQLFLKALNLDSTNN